jgi:hypothetical protein
MLSRLCHDGAFPRIVVVAVRGIVAGKTVMSVAPLWACLRATVP